MRKVAFWRLFSAALLAVPALTSEGCNCGKGHDSSGGAPGPPPILQVVVFQSDATNLVAGDTNGRMDLFARDLVSSVTTRVSVTSSGGQISLDDSAQPSLTPDGRFVAFQYGGSDLISGVNGSRIYVRDLLTGQVTTHPNVAGRDSASAPSISADGRFVAFHFFTIPPPPPAVSFSDIYVWDRSTGAMEWASATPGGLQGTGGNCFSAAISSDGRFVAFESAMDDLVPNDTNNSTDAFVHDRLTGATERVSVATNGTQGNSVSTVPAISADGRFVAFASAASNMVPGDTNAVFDIFVRDRLAGTTERVSVSSAGAQADTNSASGPQPPSISADGRYVAFEHGATNLVPGDTNGVMDIFVRDRAAGTTIRASVATGGGQADGDCRWPSLFLTGRIVAFVSTATNLVPGDTNGKADIFLHDLDAGTTQRLSVSSLGAEADQDSNVPTASSP